MRILVNTGLLILFLLLVIAVLSFWLGGAPFRLFGEIIISLGESVMDLGNGVDSFLKR